MPLRRHHAAEFDWNKPHTRIHKPYRDHDSTPYLLQSTLWLLKKNQILECHNVIVQRIEYRSRLLLQEVHRTSNAQNRSTCGPYGFQPDGVAYVDTVKNPELANLCLWVLVPFPEPKPVDMAEELVLVDVASTSSGIVDVVGVAVTVMVL